MVEAVSGLVQVAGQLVQPAAEGRGQRVDGPGQLAAQVVAVR